MYSAVKKFNHQSQPNLNKFSSEWIYIQFALCLPTTSFFNTFFLRFVLLFSKDSLFDCCILGNYYICASKCYIIGFFRVFFPILSQLAFLPAFYCCLDFVQALSLSCRSLLMHCSLVALQKFVHVPYFPAGVLVLIESEAN